LNKNTISAGDEDRSANQQSGGQAEILAITLLSCLLSAAILTGGFTLYSLSAHPIDTDIKPRYLHNLILGRPGRVNLDAKTYAILDYKLSNIAPDTTLVLFWRTTANPDGFNTMILPRAHPDQGTVALWPNKHWKNTVTHIGITQHESTDSASRIDDIVLSPYSTTGMLKAVYADWMSPAHRSHKTINYIKTTSTNSLVYPVPAFAAWAGLTLLIYYLISSIFRKRRNHQVVVVVLLAAWLILDMRWQTILWHQLIDSKNQYAGKTWREKLQTGNDAGLYTYVERLKKNLLPAAPSRIFILRKTKRWHEYQRLRIQYFLLPHNSFNFGDIPREDAIRDGDYVLVLDDTGWIRYSNSTKHLYWNDDKSKNALLVDKDPLATLYKVLPPTPAKPL